MAAKIPYMLATGIIPRIFERIQEGTTTGSFYPRFLINQAWTDWWKLDGYHSPFETDGIVNL
jgi:hypothetical protein